MGRMTTRLWPPPFNFAMPWRYRGQPIARLRRVYRRLYWSNVPVWKMPLVLLAAPLWPIAILATSLCKDLPKHGARAKAISGRSYFAQVIDQLRIGVIAGLWPHQYYVFELFRPELRHRGYEMLRRIETKRALYKLLRTDRQEEDRFKDKLRFFQACEGADIRSVPVILAAAGGKITFPDGARPLMPAADLFVKPQTGRGGTGATLIRHRDGVYRNGDGKGLTEAALVETLLERSRGKAIIVQPRLQNHPALGGISLNALSTVRVLTATNERGGGEVIAAAFRVPSRAGSVVDNFHAGGLAAAIDIETGRLDRATDMGTSADSAWHSRHPATGGAIEGVVLPHWPALVALAERAHEAIADRVVLGWDIAILPDGPCVIEANAFPDLNILQRSMLQPLGVGRLADLMVHHLDRLNPAL